MSKKAPELAFTYWSGNTLTYLHILTLRTIRSLNPSFRIVVYTDIKDQSTDFIPYNSHEHKTKIQHKLPFSALYHIPDIEIIEVDFQEQYGVGERLFHSFLADILRIKKLEEHGGVWFDMDILFLNPMSNDILTFETNTSVKTISYSNTIATGFVVALPNSKVLNDLSNFVDEYLTEGAQHNFESSADYKAHYQSFGPDLWRRVFNPYLDKRVDKHPHAKGLPVNSVYPYLWDQMDEYFSGTAKTRVRHDSTLGVHWYNGSTEARSFINVRLPNLDLSKEPTTPVEHDLRRLKDLGVDMRIPNIWDFTTKLRGCNFQGVSFQNAQLQNADFRDAQLQNANFQNANLTNADLRGANATNANFQNATMLNVLMDCDAPTQVVEDAPRETSSHTLGISIVMAAHNRKNQLPLTLESLKESKHPNFEVIIVDDASDDDQVVSDFIAVGDYEFDVKIIPISRQEKTWVNPCMAYNIGIRYATKEVILLQNAEVMHVGDVLKFTAENIRPRDWLTFNCYGLDRKKTEALRNGQRLSHSDIEKMSQRIGGNSVARDDVDGWLNHYERHFVAYHYCGAIFREDLMRDLGGFSEDFKDLIGGDDDHFVRNLVRLKYNFKISTFNTQPFTLHLHHERTDNLKKRSSADREASRQALFRSLLKWGFAPEIDIHLAPKNEVPMARRVLI